MIRLGLAFAALLLAGLLAYQWIGWPPSPAADGSSGAAGSNGAGAQGSPDELLERLEPPEDRDAYASVTERPLFRPQRKPAEAEPEVAEPPPEAQTPADLASLDLSAVVITPAVVSAWVRDNKAQELKRVRLGDELTGWVVKDIQSDRLVVERQGERNELLLRDFSKMPPPAAPPPRVRPNPAAQRMPERPTQRTPPGPRNQKTQGQDQGVAAPEPAEPRPNGPKP